MSKILKNNSGSTVTISDTGVSIPNASQYVIPAQDYWLWAASGNVVTAIGAGNLVVNDGSSDLSISNGTDLIKGIFPNPVGIRGNTDNTQIGNVGDRLKVQATVTGNSSASSYSNKLRYEDMNATTGGVARDTAISVGPAVKVYEYSGSGLFLGFLISLENYENDGYRIRLVVDTTNEILGPTGISTLTITNKDLYMWEKKAYADQVTPFILGIHPAEKGIRFQTPLPIAYSSKIEIYVEKISGGSKKFQAGLAVLTKEA